MKFKIFTMLVILGILSVTPMIYMGKFDPMSLNPLAIFDSAFDAAKTETRSLKNKLPDQLSTAVGNEKVQIYKWRDANGVMQFSNTPPAEAQAEQVMLDTNANVMQAVKIEQKPEPKPEQQAQAAMPKPYSVKGMKKVMDDAKGVEEMLQKRHEEQQKVLSNF